jgi:hypothetical protein
MCLIDMLINFILEDANRFYIFEILMDSTIVYDTISDFFLNLSLSKGVFGTAPRTLLHKLYYGAAPQKTGVRGVPL